MALKKLSAAIICVVVGVISLGSLPFLKERLSDRYFQEEPFFSYPVPLKASTATVRRDTYGKGHYGASRSGGRTHEGIDLLVGLRMPIAAAKSGRVLVVGVGKGYGNYIEILHPDGLTTRYAHLDLACVQRGDWVLAGQVVGTAGKTGNASNRKIRPHLHFEIRENGLALDPRSGHLNPTVHLK